MDCKYLFGLWLIQIGVTASVSCDGAQSPVYLGVNFLVVSGIICLFDSTAYVFLSVAVNDYMYDPEEKNGKKPCIKNKHVELMSKLFMYGLERQFKNFVQIICGFHVPQISPVLDIITKGQPESANQWRLGRRKSLRGSDKPPVLDVFAVVFAF